MLKKGFGSRESFQKCEDPSDLFYLIRHPTSNVAAKATPPPKIASEKDVLIKQLEEKLEKGELKGVGFGKFIALVFGLPLYFLFYRFPKWLLCTLIPFLFKMLVHPFHLLSEKGRLFFIGGKAKCSSFFLKLKRPKKIEVTKKTPWSLDHWVKQKLLILWNPVKNALMQAFLMPFRFVVLGCKPCSNVFKRVKSKVKFIYVSVANTCKLKMDAIKTTVFRLCISPIVGSVQPCVKSIFTFVKKIKTKVGYCAFLLHEWVTKPKETFNRLTNEFKKKLSQLLERPKNGIKYSSEWCQKKKMLLITSFKNGPGYAIKCISILLTHIEKKYLLTSKQVHDFFRKKLKAPPLNVKVKFLNNSLNCCKSIVCRIRYHRLRLYVHVRRKIRPIKRFIINKSKSFVHVFQSMIQPTWLNHCIQVINLMMKKICDKGIYAARWSRAWIVVLSRYHWTAIQSTSSRICMPFEKNL